MTKTLHIALAQINPTVGDVAGNIDVIRAARDAAARDGAHLVVFGELSVAGYPPEDLVLKEAFLRRIEDGVAQLAEDTAKGAPAVLLGAPWRRGGELFNAALLLEGGTVKAVRHKHDLPNYGVFDEKRIFSPGPLPEPVTCHGVRLGVMICEDMWTPHVARHLAGEGAEILIVLNGSPFEMGKTGTRLDLARARVAETNLPLVYVNLVGGQDELVFDGASFVLGAEGGLAAGLASWESETQTTHWTRLPGKPWSCAALPPPPPPQDMESIYQAMTVGLRDYVEKNRFPGVLIGLSGGVDSALSAAVAVDALGAGRVHCVMMPSPYTSDESLEDAEGCANMLGVKLDTISIEPAMGAFETMLRDAFADHPPDTTEENIQARSRGITLMALSNKLGTMVLSTGNKSEMSVGYATLYGDMCGGFSVLKDVYKTTVFELSRWRNRHKPGGALGPAGSVMPERVIAKPPTAELKPNQTDQDSLPPYGQLDAILKGLIEEELHLQEITAQGFDAETVKRVWTLLDRAEYKRRQAPPGVKISPRAFGRDRRYPITNGFN